MKHKLHQKYEKINIVYKALEQNVQSSLFIYKKYIYIYMLIKYQQARRVQNDKSRSIKNDGGYYC